MGGGREVQEEEDMCVPNVHDWFLLVYSRNQYNIVKQLSFSQKEINFKKNATSSCILVVLSGYRNQQIHTWILRRNERDDDIRENLPAPDRGLGFWWLLAEAIPKSSSYLLIYCIFSSLNTPGHQALLFFIFNIFHFPLDPANITCIQTFLSSVRITVITTNHYSWECLQPHALYSILIVPIIRMTFVKYKSAQIGILGLLLNIFMTWNKLYGFFHTITQNL